MEFWGHSQNADGLGVAEPLKVHVQAVAERAASFARAFQAQRQAYITGLLHDLGKYSHYFQKRVRGQDIGRDHASIGSVAALEFYKKLGLLPAMAIEGHHVGLKHYRDSVKAYRETLLASFRESPDRYSAIKLDDVMQAYVSDGLTLTDIDDGQTPSGIWSAANHLDVRMLFSCLVDADFLETQAHMEGDAQTPRRNRPPGLALQVDQAIHALHQHVDGFGAPASELARQRRLLFDACVQAAGQQQGLFTLTAPTGFGKTLAMLAFALHHAKAHGLRRIVLVMPYLNIIEQTARIYRELFSSENGFAELAVLEDHSLAKGSDDAQPTEAQAAMRDGQQNTGRPSMRRLLAENWDAPVILTTNVQLLESLMSHKPSACRKLHRLAGSVIMMDEAQTLPPHLAKATLATLSRLADPNGPYRTTVLMATATQPAFDALDGQVRPLAASGWQSREINDHQQAMFATAASRIKVSWEHERPVTVEQLGDRLASHHQVLAIVNLKRHASALATSLIESHKCKGVKHLSTSMCAAHRIKTLAEVRADLQANRPVRLISTQCVEAGVDISFPVVYRTMAPLESISQAAGRCNRHGEQPAPGAFHVVQLDDGGKILWPPGYKDGVTATEGLLRELARDQSLDGREIINDPISLQMYFTRLYSSVQRDAAILPEERDLHQAMIGGDFPSIARLYKLINNHTVSVLVPYDKAVYEQLRSQADRGFSDTKARRAWRRLASHHSVSAPRNRLWNTLVAVEFYPGEEATQDSADWFIATGKEEYHESLGLLMQDDQWVV